MKKLFIIIIILLFLTPLTTKAKQESSIAGMWGVVQFTSTLFPDFEEFEITFWSTGKLSGLEEYYNNTLIYISSYRIMINKTLIAYVIHKDPDDFIPPLEKISITLDAGDINTTETGFFYQRMTIELGAANRTSSRAGIPNDYITTEIYFEQEVSGSEMITLAAAVFLPISGIVVCIFIRQRLDKLYLENVTFRNMPKFAFRSMITASYSFLRSIISSFKRKKDKVSQG
jgi:hypothetical protein